MCFLHNKVNGRLNKPQFDCEQAFGYWGGDCGCDKKDKDKDKETK